MMGLGNFQRSPFDGLRANGEPLRFGANVEPLRLRANDSSLSAP
jgi:hypothetical protein